MKPCLPDSTLSTRTQGQSGPAFLVVVFLSATLFLSPINAIATTPTLTAFIQNHFSQENAEAGVLWIDGELREKIENILDHRFSSLRVRYWGHGSRTAWVLDEIGKELPITIGVVVSDGKIEEVTILEYRETRGGEVRYPFFTRQFQGLTLATDSKDKLNGHIDGITGATLSVNAVRKIATLALLFHQQTPYGNS